MNLVRARKLTWLAARAAAAELLAQICKAEGNEDSEEWFGRKAAALESQRPDPIDDPEANHLFWQLFEEWCHNLGVDDY